MSTHRNHDKDAVSPPGAGKSDSVGGPNSRREGGPPHIGGQQGPPPLRQDDQLTLLFWGTIAFVVAVVAAFLLLTFLFGRSPVTSESANRDGASGRPLVDNGSVSASRNGRAGAEEDVESDNGDGADGLPDSEEANAKRARNETVGGPPQPVPESPSQKAVDSQREGESDGALKEAPPGETSDVVVPDRTSAQRFFALSDKTSRARQRTRPRNVPSAADAIEHSLSGRKAGVKEELLREFGGTGATEAAVQLGLEWLMRNQLENGLWSLRGPYNDGGGMEDCAAASAMALLAFQGAGHTHQGGDDEPFSSVVGKGFGALLQNCEKDGEFLHEGNQRHTMYTQALCTIALCELFGMTRDKRYRVPASKALQFCLQAQSREGGWRYQPGLDSDMSVTGWVVMALQSGRMAGFKVPKGSLAAVTRYLNAVATHAGTRYSYQPGVIFTPSMTAEALLCRQYLGLPQDDIGLRDGIDYLLEQTPSWNSRDVYYWYYATQVCHHMEGDFWDRWNDVMSVVLPSNQVREGGERGSWDPRGDKWGNTAGRLYVTCLSLYMLEVYYRYLPIYRHTTVSRQR